LLKQQALAGDIVLLFADESEALTHPYLARAWAKRGADLRVEAPGQSEKIAMIGALDFVSRKLIVETSRTKRSSDVVDLLERLDRIYGPKIDDVRPGVERKPVATCSTTARSIQAKPRVMRSPRVSIGSSRNGWPNMPRN
jgi:hypothetical protein